MPQTPNLVYINPVDNATTWNASTILALQNNIVSYVSQYVPLVGGQMLGQILWSQNQTFPAAQVLLPTQPSYPHQGFWRTVLDHINDPSVHLQKTPPLAHATTHHIGGTDPLYGDELGISIDLGGLSIRSYVDNRVNAASAAATTNYAAATRYEIGGADPLFGNLVAISAGSPSQDIKTYVDNQITALSGSFPANPTFTTVTVSGSAGITFTNTPQYLSAGAHRLFSGDGTNVSIACEGLAGTIQFGNQTAAGAFGQLGNTGYVIGGSVYGPNSIAVNGPGIFGDDLQVSRSSLSSPTAGGLIFGQSNQVALLTYNADVPNEFYFSKPLTVSGDINLIPGSNLTVGNVFGVTGAGAALAGVPLVTGTGTGTTILGADTASGSLELRTSVSNGQPYIDFTQGATSATAPDYSQRLSLSSDGLGLVLGGSLALRSVSLNGGATPQAGDLGVARGAQQGAVYFGSAGTTIVDYGITGASIFTFTGAGTVLSSIEADGTYAASGSTYGPAGANINGLLQVQKAIYTKAGVTFGGNDGFSFLGASPTFDTGLFSTGGGDLRLYTAGIAALLFQNGGSLASFYNNVNVAGTLTTTTLASSGAAVIGGTLTLNGALSAPGTTISQFRVKLPFSLGFVAGSANTGNVYPNIVVPALRGGQIEVLRLSSLTADASTQTTFTLYKNGAVIGTIALQAGSTTASAYPIANPTAITTGDQLHAVCTQAGTATGLAIQLEISQLVY